MDTHSAFVKLGLCSWRTLSVPPMTQLVQSSHASSLYSIRVLLERITCAADDAGYAISPVLSPYSTHVLLARTTSATDDPACAISARVGLLLDPYASWAFYLCHRCGNLCNLRTPRPITRPGFSWQVVPVPPIRQLVESPNASSLYSTRFLLASTNCAADAAACAATTRSTMFQVQQSCDP